MNAKRYKTAIIGFGKIGAGYADDTVMAKYFEYATHAQVLEKHPEFLWDACVDPSPVARQMAKDRWGITHVVASIEELPEGYQPDVVVVATPPSDRDAVIDAFPKAKAFLLEKPLANSAAEAENLIKKCHSRGALVQLAFWRRADMGLRSLAEGGLEDLIGKIQGISGVYGNGVRNCGIHMIDMVRMLAGEVKSAQALSGRMALCGPLKGDADIAFHLNMVSGVPVSYIPINFREYRENSIELWGSAGRISIYQEGLVARVYRKRPNRAMRGEEEVDGDVSENIETCPGHAFYDLYNNLSEAIAGKSKLWSSGESALRSEAVLAAIWKSMENDGSRIDIA